MPFIPKFTITNTIVAALVKIEHARGFLEATQLTNDWMAKMEAKALLLEAHHTTHIEGAHLTLDQSEQLLKGYQLENAEIKDVQELLNYQKALDLVADYSNREKAIGEKLISEIHKKLVEGLQGNAAHAGHYRTTQNDVVHPKTKEIIYAPPPALQVPLMMADFLEWLEGEKETNPLLVAGIAQFQLIYIHPFLEGNGQLARLLSTLYLCRSGYDFARLFTMSKYYDRERSHYYRAIQSVRENAMNMTTWLDYFLNGLAIQLEEVQNQVRQLTKLESFTLQHSLSKREKEAIQGAIDKKSLAFKDFQLLFPETHKKTLQRELKYLLEIGLLKVEGEAKERRYLVNL